MPNMLPPSVAIAIATCPGDTTSHLTGVALFEVEEPSPGDFIYSLRVRTVLDPVAEAVLVDWLAKRLPAGRSMIAWHLAEQIVPAVIQASDAAQPRIAAALVDALATAVTIDAIDLADDHGGVHAPPLSEVCRAAGISYPSIPGGAASLAQSLTADVVAVWRLWAARARPDDSVFGRFADHVLTETAGEDGEVRCWKPSSRLAGRVEKG